MKKLLLTLVMAGVVFAPAAGIAAPSLFAQGCVAYDMVEDLGSYLTALGSGGRWLVRDLATGEELVYAFESLSMLPAPVTDPAGFKFTTFVAWSFEGTGVRGTNRTVVTGTFDPLYNFDSFYEGETFRGTAYRSGGITGTSSGNLPAGTYSSDTARIVLCKKGLPSGDD